MDKKVNLGAIGAAVRASVTSSTTGNGPDADRSTLPMVTISREAGIDTDAIATRLAELLNGRAPEDATWHVYDRRLVEQVAQEHSLPTDHVESHDEHKERLVEHVLHGLGNEPSGDAVAVKTSQTIRRLAEKGRAIIVGRGAQKVLRGRPNAIHVRLWAPEAWRAEAHAEATGQEPAAALKDLRRIDADRVQFVRSYHSQDPADHELYDLMVNVEGLSVDQTAAAIAAIVRDT